MVMVPASIFVDPMVKTLKVLSDPPRRNTAVTKLRKGPSLRLPEEMLHSELSTEAGMPESDSTAGLERSEDGHVKPKSIKPQNSQGTAVGIPTMYI